MTDPILQQMHAVFDYGLALKERLDRGEGPDLVREQAELKGLLAGDPAVRSLPDYAGEGKFDSLIAGARQGPPAFRGVRYALTCWLDEMFILDSPWSETWNEQKLESALYGTNDRAWRFWEEAKLAETRSGTAVLEAFYWCVLLGFRGELRHEPQKLDTWIKNARARLVGSQQTDWPLPPEREIPSNVEVRVHRDRFATMLRVWGAVLLIAIPVVTFVLIQRWGG